MMAHAGGRPTKYKPEFVDMLVQAMYEGLSVERFCRNTRIAKNTFYQWIKEYPEFEDAFRNGKSDAQAYWQETAIQNFENKNFNTNLFKLYMVNCHDWTNDNKLANPDNNQSKDSQLSQEMQDLIKKHQKDI